MSKRQKTKISKSKREGFYTMSINKKLCPAKKINGKTKFTSYGKSMDYDSAKKFMKKKRALEMLRWSKNEKKR